MKTKDTLTLSFLARREESSPSVKHGIFRVYHWRLKIPCTAYTCRRSNRSSSESSNTAQEHSQPRADIRYSTSRAAGDERGERQQDDELVGVTLPIYRQRDTAIPAEAQKNEKVSKRHAPSLPPLIVTILSPSIKTCPANTIALNGSRELLEISLR